MLLPNPISCVHSVVIINVKQIEITSRQAFVSLPAPINRFAALLCIFVLRECLRQPEPGAEDRGHGGDTQGQEPL